jgi:hypothetical protein
MAKAVKSARERGQAMDVSARIAQLERQIADLEARLPRHSVPASMLLELEELEAKLNELSGGGHQETS